MILIQNLPSEVILIILENVTISLKDVENFGSTCVQFQRISHDKNLWRKKYAERWPSAKVHFKNKVGVKFDNANIEDLKEGMKCAEDLWLYVSRLPKMYYCGIIYSNINFEDMEDTKSNPI
ncbi:uncharacterized protein LOC114931821 [Nylanderia fulva]|uniref:uncharacterized protein LOC114931821 n=1 Tax=Nylanderia fulva TaxID=613905 RepID=UPI0010FAF9DE|nr:uncharacterized protein LOC114931821 [Nylanderia fulva]